MQEEAPLAVGWVAAAPEEALMCSSLVDTAEHNLQNMPVRRVTEFLVWERLVVGVVGASLNHSKMDCTAD